MRFAPRVGRRVALVPAIILVSCAGPRAGTPPPAPTPVGPSAPVPAATPSTDERVTALLAEWDRDDAPGFSLAVVRGGEVVDARGLGMANLEHGIANAPETVFDLGSTSKQFTAACIALLALDGTLSLDDDIRRFLPEIPDYGRPITIRHLLHHTSGIRDYLTLMMLAGYDVEDLTGETEALAIIARQRSLNFLPGDEHLYSNSGYFLLSVIARRASGKPLAELAHERIFEPLGMTSTHIHDDHARVVPRRATGYAPADGGGFEIAMSDWEQTGDGAVMSTVLDLARWDRNFATGDVGGAALRDLLLTRGRLADGRDLDYALGLSLLDLDGQQVIAHGGAWAGYRAQMLRFPERGLAVICLANRVDVDPSDIAWQVAAIHLDLPPREERRGPRRGPEGMGAADPAPPPELGAEEAAGYAGEYASEELAVSYAVAADGGRLTIGLPIESRLPLERIGPDAFGVGGMELRFTRDADGRVDGFTIDAGRVRGIRCERVR